MWGKIPSSMPTRNTAGNSRPLAMCMVMSETLVPSPSSWSESATREAASRNSASVRYSAAMPTRVSTFSTRPSASMVPSASSSLR